MGNINRTNFELIVELRKKKNILLRIICCQKRKLLEFTREIFFYIHMKANINKSIFLERQRGHWRGIDSRKLPSAEKTFWENKNLNEDFLYNCFFSGRII